MKRKKELKKKAAKDKSSEVINSPSNGLTNPELFQSNSASGTVSVGAFEGCGASGLVPVEDFTVELCDDDGLSGSIGLKLRFAANRGMLDEADDDAH